MRKLITILIISVAILCMHDMKNSHAKEIKLSRLNKILCKSARCDIYKFYPATEKCLDAFDQYFETTGGEMPSCIPKYEDVTPGDPLPINEMWCYANWKIYSRENCDPIFDPALNEYGIIDESDGATPYEICLMNEVAKMDVCLFGNNLRCWSLCYRNNRCYVEYLMTDDYAAYQECLARISNKLDKCMEKKCTSYFYPPESN